MREEIATTGRLIALEGTRGRDLAEAAARLWRLVGHGPMQGGISRWDASGTFYEMRLGQDQDLTASARTLLLLYASDLAFRLRWEIRLALEVGQCVIAAPYVESAVAFGAAAGLPRAWLVELFRFAPKPQACYRIKERKTHSTWKGKLTDGYLEFCGKLLCASSPGWDPVEVRRKMIDYLDALERRGGCQTLTKSQVSGLKAQITAQGSSLK